MSKIITLQNGTRLKCFEKAGCEDAKSIDNSMQIDLTGVYFQLGREKHRKKKKHIRLEDRPEVQLFLMNAHYLFEHSNDILNDSRMFLCPVPFENILLCFGVSGFRHPTLGVYIEWWERCQDVRLLDEQGEKWLLYQLAGSPLTHCNSCGLVNSEGETTRQHIGKCFMDVCRLFIRINRRYDDVKPYCEAYSMEDVLKRLRRRDKVRELRKNVVRMINTFSLPEQLIFRT